MCMGDDLERDASQPFYIPTPRTLVCVVRPSPLTLGFYDFFSPTLRAFASLSFLPPPLFFVCTFLLLLSLLSGGTLLSGGPT